MNQTPRSLLLARHTAATGRLDDIRCTAVDDSLPVTGYRILPSLFAPNRPLWVVLAAAWIAILALYLTQPQSPRPDAQAVEYAARIHAATKTQLYALHSTFSSDH